MEIPGTLPLLPIRNAVVFPGASMPLIVGRPRSVRAVQVSRRDYDNLLVVVTQRLPTNGDPSPDELYRTGALCRIDSLNETESGTYQLVLTGISRYRIGDISMSPDTPESEGVLLARGDTLPDVHGAQLTRSRALFNSLKRLAKDILDLLPGSGDSLSRLVDSLDDATYLTNLCAAYLSLPVPEKQALLENPNVEARMEHLLSLMQKEREVLSIQKDIQEKMSERIGKAQREALLREQMRTIREELGEEAGEVEDELGRRLASADLPPEVDKIAADELKRLEALPPAAAEYHVIRTYLEWLADMPWNKSTKDVLNLANARKILDEDHFGLERVKKRIVQYLAVAKLKNDLHGPILCLLGPPGVGKTSLGQSIARALGRKFIRASLGGVKDEAEIRGHRRTYIGAMPGRIAQSIKRVGVRNPLFMLDEIDKLGASFQGDPAAALLEVLDPEQNRSYVDHYLDVPFDLSNVFFVATANVADTIPPALRDRMELIEVSSYTTIEKLQIARRHLVPRQLEEHGLKPGQVALGDDALLEVIHRYTREAGVRELAREIAALLRACAEEMVEKNEPSTIALSAGRVAEILGPPKFHAETTERSVRPGVVTGLAWTSHGGDILFIEASLMPGTGKLLLTGSLGEVMKESVQIAMSFIRSEAAHLLPQIQFDKLDVHVHVPSGAIPKDGPSAGVTMLAAIASLLLGRTVNPKLGMTGELTLRGAVLPVGGIKEKLLAAHRAGISKVLVPYLNEQDVSQVPAEVRRQLEIRYLENAEDVLGEALGISQSELHAKTQAPAA
ncbi:MAG: endopeptidase La [Deltaproteobacteria bacterium]|nr:endopeptidase La [Deltaproteobacteria bacterium]